VYFALNARDLASMQTRRSSPRFRVSSLDRAAAQLLCASMAADLRGARVPPLQSCLSMEKRLRCRAWADMSSFLQDHVDSDAILADIRSIVEIESPSRNVAGVNRVLETIARFFEGTDAKSTLIRPIGIAVQHLWYGSDGLLRHKGHGHHETSFIQTDVSRDQPRASFTQIFAHLQIARFERVCRRTFSPGRRVCR
jgi:hypothetical protein